MKNLIICVRRRKHSGCVFSRQPKKTSCQDMEGGWGQKGIRVGLCRLGLCLVGALYQVAVASMGSLWPAIPTNHTHVPTIPVGTQSKPAVWCQTHTCACSPTRTHAYAYTHTHCSQLHFQTWITTELTFCDLLPKQTMLLYKFKHTHMRTCTYPPTPTTTSTHRRHTRCSLGGVIYV